MAMEPCFFGALRLKKHDNVWLLSQVLGLLKQSAERIPQQNQALSRMQLAG
jgi:hypothetical protein